MDLNLLSRMSCCSFFRLLCPGGKPLQPNPHWFHAICYEKIAKHIGTEFNISVREFTIQDSIIAMETPMNKYMDSQIKPTEDFTQMRNSILDGFQTLSDVLQVTNEPKYRSVVAVIKELKGTIPDDLLPCQPKNLSKKKGKNQPQIQPQKKTKSPINKAATNNKTSPIKLSFDAEQLFEIENPSRTDQIEIINHVTLDNPSDIDQTEIPSTNKPNPLRWSDQAGRFNKQKQFEQQKQSNQSNQYNQTDRPTRIDSYTSDQDRRVELFNQFKKSNQSDQEDQTKRFERFNPDEITYANQSDQPRRFDQSGPNRYNRTDSSNQNSQNNQNNRRPHYPYSVENPQRGTFGPKSKPKKSKDKYEPKIIKNKK